MLLLFWLLLSCGVVCFGIGLRGRVISQELRCGRCGYNLTGIDRSPHTLCPECGHGIWTGVVVRRQRRIAIRPVKFALLLGVLAAGCIIIHIIDVRIGLDWYRLRNAEALKRIIMDDDGNHAGRARAWAELHRRRRDGSLSEDDREEITAFALDRHITLVRDQPPLGVNTPPYAIPLMDLGPDHAAWIQSAINEKLLSDDIIAAYAESLFQPFVEVNTRMQMNAGEPFNVWINMYGRPVGSDYHVEVPVMLETVTVDGQAHDFSTNPACSGAVGRSTWSTLRPAISFQIPMQIPVGKHRLVLTLRCGVSNLEIGRGDSQISLGHPSIGWNLWPPTINEWTVTRAVDVDVRESRNASRAKP